jgi:hypothetical protein
MMMPRLPIPDADADQWGAVLNEFLLVAHHENGALRQTNPWFDARNYNQGVLNDSTIRLALAAIGPTKATLLLAAGSWTISDNLEVPEHVALLLAAGAELQIAVGKTVAIKGPLLATKTTLFTGAGKVALGSCVDEVYPEWWAAEVVQVPTAGGTTIHKCNHLQKAIDTGKHVILSGTYDLGSTCIHGYVFLEIKDKHHQKLIGKNQAKLVCTTTANSSTDTIPRMLEIIDSSFIEIDNLSFEDFGVSTTSYRNEPRVGAAAIHLRVSDLPNPNETKHIALRNLQCQKLIHTLVVQRDGGEVTKRIHSITVDNVNSEYVRYGINCQNNGDNLVVRNFRTLENVRDYFVYGVCFHDVEIYSKGPLSNDGTYNIARLQYDTKNIKVRARVEEKLAQEAALVSVGHSWHVPSANALISDIDLDIDLRDGQHGRLVEFVSYNETGAAESTTLNRWENIRIRGVDVNQNNVITWRTVPVTKVGIELSPLTYHFARLDNRSANITRNFQGCYLVSGPGRRIYFAQGRLSANSVAINLSQFLYQDFVLHFKVWALSGATRLRNYREDIVFVYLSGDAGSTVGIQDVKNVFNHFLTAEAGVTYTPSSNSRDLFVNFPNYSDANDDGAAVVEVAIY